MTTRIRINIPGSRPIPPVVMRTPVDNADGAAGAGGADEGLRTPMGGAAASAAGAPRAARAAAAEGPGGTAGPAGAVSASGGPGGGRGPDGSGGTGGSGGPGGSEPTQGTSDWFAPRKPPKAAPGAGSGSPPAGSGSPGGPPSGGAYPESPYPPDSRAEVEDPQGHPQTPAAGFPAVGREDTSGGIPRSAIADLMDTPPPRPSGPTSGPGTGDMPLTPPGAVGPPVSMGSGPRAPGAPEMPRMPGAPGGPGEEPPASSTLGLGTGPSAFADGQGPEPSSPYAGGSYGEERIASDTLVSGIQRVPSVEESGGFPAVPRPAATGGRGGDEERRTPAPAPSASKGRSKLVLVGAGLFGVLGIAYGAGLLLDHADVPNGTTVLGVDIGGKDKQQAVNTLDAALGNRTTEALTVVVDGSEMKLKPSVAGLTVDTAATVREASGRDYNPVSVIGSLLGGSRQAEAAVEVDEAKLKAALEALADKGGSGADSKDGMVKFVDGKAVGVPGEPHKGIDVNKASTVLEEAYRERAVSGKNKAIELPVSTQQPQVGKKDIRQAVDGFGRTAMSGWVWLQAGTVEVPFSEKTLSTFLTMQPGGGELQPVIDTAELAKAYGSAFDNVVIDAGTGTVKMTPEHAAAAMVQALKKEAPPEPGKRLAVVEGARTG